MSDPEYKIELDAYAGPLDLLLYLIRREEVDIYDIPVARITRQYLEYIDVISELNINIAGEFVVMAATLMEIKSRMMAPQPEVGPDEEEPEDPRMDLVRQLMEYKQFKEAALELKERAQERGERFARPGERVDGKPGPVTSVPDDLTLWALLDAFSRMLEQTGRRGPHHVVLDETPQAEVIARLEERARAAGRISFIDAFGGEKDRGVLIAMFLALLELVKRQALSIEQEGEFADIWLTYVPESERVVYEETEPVEAEPSSVDEDEDEEEWDDVDLDDLDDIPDVPEADVAPDASPLGSDEAQWDEEDIADIGKLDAQPDAPKEEPVAGSTPLGADEAQWNEEDLADLGKLNDGSDGTTPNS